MFAEDPRRSCRTLDHPEKDAGGKIARICAEGVLGNLGLELADHKKDEGLFVLDSNVGHTDFLTTTFFLWSEKVDDRQY